MNKDTVWIPRDKEWLWKWLMNWIDKKNADWHPGNPRAKRYRKLLHPEYRNVIQGDPPYTFEVWQKLVGGSPQVQPSNPERLLSIVMTEFERKSKLVIEYSKDIGVLREEFWLALDRHSLPTYMIPANSEPEPIASARKTQDMPPRLLADVVAEANQRFDTGDDDWWRYILTFQNEWNKENPNSRLTNKKLGEYLDNREESTVKNMRSKLGLSTPLDTRPDLKKLD